MPTDNELELLGRLVACPSVTGTPSEIIDILEPELLALGGNVGRVPVDGNPGAEHPEYTPPFDVSGEQPPVLCADFAGEGPELLLFAHTDTEPVHPGWESDHFTLRVVGGCATGLGVADDKAGIVAVLAAVARWKNTDRPGWRPRVVFGAGKQGGALGMLPGVLAASGVSAALYSHPAESGLGLSHLKVASRGIVQCRVRVPGRTPEPVEERTPVSADPTTGHNAAARAARLAVRIEEWHVPDRVWSVVALRGGQRPYEVPNVAELDVACWFTSGTADTVVHELRGRLTGVGDQWAREHPPEVEAVGVRANPADCAASPLAHQVAATVTKLTGQRPVDYRWHSASDIRFPVRCLGIPCVGLGARAGGFYGPGEWVDLASLDDCIEVLSAVLREGPS